MRPKPLLRRCPFPARSKPAASFQRDSALFLFQSFKGHSNCAIRQRIFNIFAPFNGQNCAGFQIVKNPVEYKSSKEVTRYISKWYSFGVLRYSCTSERLGWKPRPTNPAPAPARGRRWFFPCQARRRKPARRLVSTKRPTPGQIFSVSAALFVTVDCINKLLPF